MLAEYKTKTNIGVGIGIVVLVVGEVVLGGLFGRLIALFGLGLFIWGCMSYMKGKGYHGAWGLLGLFWLVGLIVLAIFPDRHKDSLA